MYVPPVSPAVPPVFYAAPFTPGAPGYPAGYASYSPFPDPVRTPATLLSVKTTRVLNDFVQTLKGFERHISSLGLDANLPEVRADLKSRINKELQQVMSQFGLVIVNDKLAVKLLLALTGSNISKSILYNDLITPGRIVASRNGDPSCQSDFHSNLGRVGLVLIEILNERPKIEASPAAPVVDGLPVYGAGEPAYSPAASAPPASAARLSSSEREELAVRQVLKDADAENQALTAAGDEVLGRLHHEARVADTKRGAAARTTFIAEAMAAQVSRGTEQAEQAQRLSIEAEMKKAQATDRLASAVKRPTAE